jgi:Uma2 family endonuclease
MTAPARTLPSPATLADLLALPEEERFEIVAGELVEKEAARIPHGRAQLAVGHSLYGAYSRRGGGPPDRPGGWWFASEVLIQFSPQEIRRPDVAGWLRDRMPEAPANVPVTIVPDWICEVVSPANAGNDTITKMRLYHEVKVPHYWLIDPQVETLTVYRWHPDGYLHVLGARRDERVRAEPFDAVQLQIGVFFGEDED